MIINDNHYKTHSCFKLFFFLVTIFLSGFLFQSSTHAIVQENDIMKKWVITQYYQCLRSGNINNRLSRENENGEMRTGDVRLNVMKEEGSLHLPSYSYGHYGSDVVDCNQLFIGGEDLNEGVVDYVGYGDEISWQDGNKTREFLKKVGYSEQENSRQSVMLNWRENDEDKSIIIVPNGNKYKLERADTNYYGSTFELSFGDNSLTVTFGSGRNKISRNIGYGNNINSFINNINSAQGLGGFNTTVEYDSGFVTLQRKYVFSSSPASLQSVSSYSFDMDASNAVQSLTGSSNINEDFRLNNNEKYTLYSNYLVVASRANNGQITCSEEQTENGWFSVLLKYNNEFTNCYVNLGTEDLASMDRVYTQTEQGNIIIKTISMQEMINWFNNNIPDNVEIDQVPNIDEINSINNDASEESNANCLGSDVGFAFIICPLINTVANTAEGIYSSFVEPSLRVEPQLFTGAAGNELGRAWGIFRDFANIIFVIVLLVVIFSQLTGYGITNYGIKKLLPKLIIAVVLINLSYLVCVACVDLSNIFGNGLKQLFDNLGSGISAVPTVEGQSLGNASSAGIISIGILGSVVGVAALFLNPALIITLLVAALGVLISIFFMFILLALRQAAIIVLIVISPVIIVLYILPNTQKYFDKMFKLWGALMFLYPIMGLLIGGGNFVAKLLLSIGFAGSGTFQAFAAMVVGIIPIFMAPELVNNALAGLNGLGAKISGIGQQFSRGATGAIKSTSGYKSLQQAGAARSNRLMAGLDKNGRPNAFGNFLGKVAGSKLGGLGYSRLYRSRINAARKDEAEQREAMATAGEVQREYADSKNPKTDYDYFKDQLMKVSDSKDDNKKLAVLAQMDKSNLQNSKKAELFREVFGTKPQDAIFLRKVAQTYGGGFLTKDYEALDWARKGGLNGNESTALGGAGEWAKTTYTENGKTKRNINLDDLKDEQVAQLSSANKAALINSGGISKQQAQRVWASNANMDDVERLILGAYGNEGKTLTKEQAQEAIRNKEEWTEKYTRRAPQEVHEVGGLQQAEESQVWTPPRDIRK